MYTATVPDTHTGTYVLDVAQSHIGFAVRLMTSKVRGQFTALEGIGFFDAADPSNSRIELRLNAASVDTGNPKRDAHLRSNAFLGVDAHPEIKFVSTAIEPIGADHYRATGDLTIKGMTRPITVEVRHARTSFDEDGRARIDFEGRAVVHRGKWGVRWNAFGEGGGLIMSNKAVVEFAVAAHRSNTGDGLP
jgi:polyisoprenoid-binding protein YceI